MDCLDERLGSNPGHEKLQLPLQFLPYSNYTSAGQYKLEESNPGANFTSQKIGVKFLLVEFFRTLIEDFPLFSSLGVYSAQLQSNVSSKLEIKHMFSQKNIGMSPLQSRVISQGGILLLTFDS